MQSNDNNDNNNKNKKSDEDTAATILQKHIRRQNINNQYIISPSIETSEAAYIWGNDPSDMLESLPKQGIHNKKFALIGTSCLRNVAIACTLNMGNDKLNTPKLFIIDNSSAVCNFWTVLKKFVEDKDEKTFLKKLDVFINELTKNSIETKEGQESFDKFKSKISNIFNKLLFNRYGFDNVKAIILHASIIPGSWADTMVFDKVTNLIKWHGIEQDNIYMYPSNIVMYCCFNDLLEEAKNVMTNIMDMNPHLTIHTDLNKEFQTASQCFVIPNGFDNMITSCATLVKSCYTNPISNELSISEAEMEKICIEITNPLKDHLRQHLEETKKANVSNPEKSEEKSSSIPKNKKF